jgi:hypothetical protein
MSPIARRSHIGNVRTGAMKAMVMLLAISVTTSCITGPTCVARQRRGTIEPVTGTVAAGGVASHIVRYAVEGSQNNLEISWGDSRLPDGPRVSVYVTRASCTTLNLSTALSDGECAVLGRGGAIDNIIATPVIVTHGRGNPEVLGSPPIYKVWIVGDPERAANYTIDISWFFGPDC